MTTSAQSPVTALPAPGARARWVAVSPPDPHAVRTLIQEARVSGVLARLLAIRGHSSPAAAEAFLEPRLDMLHDPNLLPGMQAAVETLLDAKARGETIGVYGDYDVDGVTSVAFLVRALRRMGFSVVGAVPHRTLDGYGLSPRILNAWAAEGIHTVLTCDVGVSNAAVVRDMMAQHDMRFVITDHHRPPADLPPAAAVVDPILPGSAYPFPGLCGVGVSLKLIMSLFQASYPGQGRNSGEVVGDLLDLVAIGTVADVVSLTDENRSIVQAGLRRLRRTTSPGLQAMIEVNRLDPDKIDATTIGFRLGPQLNAAGRIADANTALQLLLAETPEIARPLAQEVFRLNDERKDIQAKIVEAAETQVRRLLDEDDAFGLAVFGPGPESPAKTWWNPGVVGIVAARIRENTGRPTFVFSWDGSRWKGSGRAETAEGFDLYTATAACAPLLEKFGGHGAAAGATIAEGVTPDAFRAAFDAAVRAQVGAQAPQRVLTVDVEASFADLTLESVEAMARAEPFGKDNPMPKILVRGVTLDVSRGTGAMRRIGDGGKYLKATLLQNGTPMDAVVFEAPDHVQAILSEGPADVVAEIEVNVWNKQRNVQARLIDACRAQAPEQVRRAPSARELFRG